MKEVKKFRFIPILLAVILAVFLLLSSVTTIPAGHTGVVTTFGKVSGTVLGEGLHFKLPFITNVVKIDNRVLKTEVSSSSASKDLQTVNSTIALNYRIGRAIGQRQELLSGKYSAFIAINDMVAIGVIDALSAHGIQFPRDYSIVGFDNLLYTGLSRISLTTVDHHTDILAQAAISLLLRRVDPSMEPALLSSTRFKVECTPQLVVRNSTAPLA